MVSDKVLHLVLINLLMDHWPLFTQALNDALERCLISDVLIDLF